MDVKEIIREINDFRQKRGWEDFHTPQNLAKSIIIESNELLKNSLINNIEDSLENIKEEISDVMIYSFYLYEKLNFSIEKNFEKISKKTTINEKNFKKIIIKISIKSSHILEAYQWTSNDAYWDNGINLKKEIESLISLNIELCLLLKLNPLSIIEEKILKNKQKYKTGLEKIKNGN